MPGKDISLWNWLRCYHLVDGMQFLLPDCDVIASFLFGACAVQTQCGILLKVKRTQPVQHTMTSLLPLRRSVQLCRGRGWFLITRLVFSPKIWNSISHQKRVTSRLLGLSGCILVGTRHRNSSLPLSQVMNTLLLVTDPCLPAKYL